MGADISGAIANHQRYMLHKTSQLVEDMSQKRLTKQRDQRLGAL
jgi:hypothetical protein